MYGYAQKHDQYSGFYTELDSQKNEKYNNREPYNRKEDKKEDKKRRMGLLVDGMHHVCGHMVPSSGTAYHRNAQQ